MKRRKPRLHFLGKENSEQRELLKTRKKQTKGKRVALQGKFVFNTEEVLEVVQKAEVETAKRKPSKRRRNASLTPELEEIINEVPEQEDNDSERSCIDVALRK